MKNFNFTLRTIVDGHYLEVMQRFDLQLFEALAPPVARMEIVEFTGSEKGDRVHIRFLSPIRAEWISYITEHGSDDKQAYFVDEGVKLPPGLSYWRHRHVVQKIDERTSCIIDDITYRSSTFVLSILMYPGIFFGFYPRKKIYRQYFNKLFGND